MLGFEQASTQTPAALVIAVSTYCKARRFEVYGLSYREAARVVRRSPRTIRYWRQQGMPMGWDVRDGQRVRVVDEETLKAWWRQRMMNWPTHRWRLRAQLAAAQEVDQSTGVAPSPGNPAN